MYFSISKEARTRLEEIERRDGSLKVSVVVDEAVNPASPLHRYFEWDNDAAAATYRLEQARQIIRSVHVVVITETVTIKAPAYVRDPRAGAKGQGYASIRFLRTDDELARDAITAEFARVRDALTRAKTIALALSLENDVETLLREVAALEQRVQRPAA